MKIIVKTIRGNPKWTIQRNRELGDKTQNKEKEMKNTTQKFKKVPL